MNKFYVCTETGSVYKLDEGSLFFTPIFKDGTYDLENDWNLVEEDLVDEEVISDGRTLGDLYAEVKAELGE